MDALFVESICRLYKDGRISKEKVVQLYESEKITREELDYILNVNSDVDVE